MQLQQHGFTVYIDLDGYANPWQLFNGYRPDVVIFKGGKITVVELTICFETNVIKSREFKKNKYSTLNKNVTVEVSDFNLILLEITTLGFYAKQKVLEKMILVLIMWILTRYLSVSSN